MPTPRPYGRGPYGKGPYERYRGTIYDVAGASSIAWETEAAPSFSLPFHGRTSLTWVVQGAVLGRTIDLGAARSSLTFETRALGMQMVIAPRAISEIVFTLDGEGSWSWDMTGLPGCWPGTWDDADTCQPGGWAPYAPCGDGLWTSTAGSAGVWTPPPACNTGTWSRQ